MTRYMMPARFQGKLYAQRRLQAERDTHRWVFVHSLTPEVEHAVRSGPYVQPHDDKRKPFTVGVVRVRTTPRKATLELCDRLSNLLIEVDAVMHKDLLPDVVCDLGYGIAPSTAIDEGMLPIPDYHVLWPGKPTMNTVWTAVEDYTWFEAFSEEGRATGISCTPALHMQSERKTEDGGGEG